MMCEYKCCRVAKLIGDKRAVVAERGFNRPYTKILVTNCGVLS
jgi:peptidyl-prolyl cis-trans isomerase B (cyclophilin B)